MRRLVEMNPSHANDHRTLARLLKKHDRVEEAVPILQHVLSFDASTTGDFRALAKALLTMKRDAEAESVCTAGIAAWPDYNCLYMLRGNARWHQDKTEAARQDYDRALELNARCVSALLNRGNLSRGQGDTDGMLEDWLKVLDREPKNTKAHQHLANHFLGQQMWDQCLFHAGEAIRKAPSNARARAMFGRAQFELGEGEAALDDLDRAVSDGPDIAEVHKQRGIVLVKLGHPDLQIEDCRIALQNAPGDTGIAFNLGVRLAQTGSVAEAFDIFDDLVSRRGRLSDHRWRGECHRLLGRLPKAIADLEHALSMKGISDENFTWITEKIAAARKAMAEE